VARLDKTAGAKGEAAAQWVAFTEAALVLLRGGDYDGALVRQVLDCQDHVWDEEDRESKRKARARNGKPPSRTPW
jgi:hypothetical protein